MDRIAVETIHRPSYRLHSAGAFDDPGSLAALAISRAGSVRRLLARMKKSTDAKTQVAALPYRKTEDGRIEVLLVTSRETRRWLIPKGGMMKGKTPWEAAAQEALEEAGVEGKIAHQPLGHYTYWKRKADHFALYKVDVYSLKVRRQLKTWPEQGERDQQWFDVAIAPDRILEPALAELIRRLPDEV
jgi:8-oxo-dGTP pyrophosphatase MutT (NUDIX family)